MVPRTLDVLPELYEADETAWLEAMADLIRQGRYTDLDYRHLREYLEDMAVRDRHEVESRLVTLIAHLLKWAHQPKKRTRSWRATILVQRRELNRAIGRGILRNHAEATLAEAYAEAVKEAATETGLAVARFPAECTWTLHEILASDLPEK